MRGSAFNRRRGVSGMSPGTKRKQRGRRVDPTPKGEVYRGVCQVCDRFTALSAGRCERCAQPEGPSNPMPMGEVLRVASCFQPDELCS